MNVENFCISKKYLHTYIGTTLYAVLEFQFE